MAHDSTGLKVRWEAATRVSFRKATDLVFQSTVDDWRMCGIDSLPWGSVTGVLPLEGGHFMTHHGDCFTFYTSRHSGRPPRLTFGRLNGPTIGHFELDGPFCGKLISMFPQLVSHFYD